MRFSRMLVALTACLGLLAGAAGCNQQPTNPSTSGDAEQPAPRATGSPRQGAGFPSPSATGAAATAPRSDTASSTPPDREISAVVKNGDLSGPVRTVRASVGESIEITVRSDIPTHVIVHSYGTEFPVRPGAAASTTITPKEPGVFRVRTSRLHVLVAVIKVS